MKKFMLVVVMLCLSSFASASALRCAEGGLVGGGLGSLLGGGNGKLAFEVFGALVGCDIATSQEPQTVVTRRVVAVSGPPAMYPGQYQRAGYRQSSYGNMPCPAHWEGGYFMQEGYRRNHNQGGVTRDGCGHSMIQPANYVVQETTTRQVERVDGPTVGNYTEDKYIRPSCKTGNPGADGKCLLRFVESLALEQKACEGETSKTACPKAYNPGKWAGIYYRLGNELVAKQKELQGGDISLK